MNRNIGRLGLWTGLAVLTALVATVSWRSAPTPSTEEFQPQKGARFERWFFQDWHQPYGHILDRAFLDPLWDEIETLPQEPDLMDVNAWESIGPWGMVTPSNARMSGRILDIEFDTDFRAASASGGLWQYFLFFPLAMTDNLKSQIASTMDTHPSDNQTILLGTGELYVRGGSGMWKTTDGGGSWERKPMTPETNEIVRVRYDPGGEVAHAVGRNGYWRSTDSGESWNRIQLTAPVTDLAIDPSNPQRIWAPMVANGLFLSTNAGQSWTLQTASGLPTTAAYRTAVAVAPSDGNYVYVAMSDVDSNLLGIYRTTNGGSSWQNVSPTIDHLDGQGWYDNVISVSPTDPNVVLAGGITLLKTTNGGVEFSWYTVSSPHLHADYHAMLWGDNGADVWVGHDGGWSYSADAGVTWDTTVNVLPITQYVEIAAGESDVNTIAGASQDNGISFTTDGGTTWNHNATGDGGGVSIDPVDSNRMWMTNGVYNGNWAWERFRSTNHGTDWTRINSGVDPAGTWFTEIHNDRVHPVYLYTNSGPFVYESLDYGTTWNKLNPTAFPSGVGEVTVSHYASPKAVIYATIGSTPGERLRVYDSDGWYERSTGLPNGQSVRYVAPHPEDPDLAVALINGLGSPGEKLFYTNNRGVTWTNMTGDLPNLPMGGVVLHPDNDQLFYLGTEMGCYRTTNGGANWERWNNGLPEAAIVTYMTHIDQREQTGEFFVIAGTYGRSMWTREISGDDPPSSADEFPLGAPDETRMTLAQNFPNPASSSTRLRFVLPRSAEATLDLFDASGRQVARLVDGPLDAGRHELDIDVRAYPSGVYFYRLSSSGEVASRKLIIE